MFLRINIYILTVAVAVLCTAATAHAQVAQPAAWSKTPTMSEDVRPSYNFGSTSSYTPIVGSTSYLSDGSGPVSSPQRAKSWSPWDDDKEPEGNPGGVLDQTPVGEPLILLLMAAIYALICVIRHNKPRHIE